MRPDAFAAVMATGIVSIAAADHGLRVVSVGLAVIAVVALPALVYATAIAWKRDSWKLSDLETASGLFTYVAACAVLAVRFSEHRVVTLVLGGMALQGWLSLVPLVVRGMWRLRWTGLRDRAHGGWELVSVATSGLAIVCVELGILFWAFIFWALALFIYGVMTGFVCWRAAHEPAARRDVPPDHWILMGGLAIATLAGVHLHGALFPGPIADAVRIVTVVTWAIASVQLVPLTVVGWRRVRAWPVVFPLGMYSAASYALAGETGWEWLVAVSLVFLVVALALWLLTLLRIGRGRLRPPQLNTPKSPV